MSRFRKNDELFGAIATPARRNGDAIFLVDRVLELARVDRLAVGRCGHMREEICSTLTHFPPPLTTFHARGQ